MFGARRTEQQPRRLRSPKSNSIVTDEFRAPRQLRRGSVELRLRWRGEIYYGKSIEQIAAEQRHTCTAHEFG
jgi:hypothetical protein